MNEAVYIKVDGSIESKNKRPTLEEAQAFVGGFVQMVVPQGDHDAQMLMDEDGKMKALPVNIKGTELYQHEAIRGNIILLYGRCRWIN